MNRIFLALCSLVLIFTACQKETSFEKPIPAEGFLQNAFGDCMPHFVNGVYSTGSALRDTNFVTVDVIVTKPGAYTITTDTVNGYYFKGTGTFNAVDTFQNVVLKGFGTPSVAGIDRFTVSFSGTFCEFEVDVIQGSGGGGNTAIYTLNATGGSCDIQKNGTYTVGTPMNTLNTVVLDINVTTLGSWSLTTSAGGITFSGAGTFVSTGPQRITLNASGTPTTGGTQNFSLTAGASTCTFQIPVAGGSGGTGCNATPAGTYTAGTALTASNTVTVQHTFAAAGTYNVSAPAQNGYGFAASVTVTAAGAGQPQSIVLNGTGTPTAASTNNFTVNFGDGSASTCTFAITVVPAGGTTGGVYFPLTLNSYWTYDTGNDTLKTTNVGNVTLGGNSYSRFVTVFQGSSINDTGYYRKSTANAYFRRVDTAGLGQYGLKFTSSSFDVEFLRDVLTQGQALITTVNASFQPAGFPLPLTAQVKFTSTCINANATITSSLGVTFSNVYEVETIVEVIVSGMPFPVPLPNITNWYARNVGLIGSDDGTDIQEIRYWRVF